VGFELAADRVVGAEFGMVTLSMMGTSCAASAGKVTLNVCRVERMYHLRPLVCLRRIRLSVEVGFGTWMEGVLSAGVVHSGTAVGHRIGHS
jgi:hypothetical protein